MTTGARRPDVGTSQAGLEKLIAEILPPQGQCLAGGPYQPAD